MQNPSRNMPDDVANFNGAVRFVIDRRNITEGLNLAWIGSDTRHRPQYKVEPNVERPWSQSSQQRHSPGAAAGPGACLTTEVLRALEPLALEPLGLEPATTTEGPGATGPGACHRR